MNTSIHPPIQPAPLWHEPHDATSFVVGERQPRVLVVEDDPVQALILTLMLKHLGVSSMLVTDGEQAIEAVKGRSYALVLMDYLMPGTDGIAATRSIRRWERDTGRLPTPIAAVTASAMADECQRYAEAGMDDVLIKPYSAQTLAELLARHGPTLCGVQAPVFNRLGARS